MTSKMVERHTQLALDESTSEELLSEIWYTSKSVKVRRAVARNPNCSAKILQAAARLYLEDVLNNPGFSMLELFCDDPWIKNLSLAYREPDSFLAGGNPQSVHISQFSKKSTSLDSFGWAILLSPQLSNEALNKTISIMSSGGLKRAFKNLQIKNKISELFEEFLYFKDNSTYYLGTLLLLYREKIISKEQLSQALNLYPVGSESAQRSVYVKYINSLYKEYKNSTNFTERDFISKLLARTLIVSRTYSLNWIFNSHVSHVDLQSWQGELYTHVLKFMAKGLNSKRFYMEDTIRRVGGIVTTYLWLNFVDDYEQMYSFIKSHELDNLYLNKLYLTKLNLATGGSRLQPLKLSNCSIEVKKFFCSAGCLGNWVTIANSDVKYQIINEVNEHIYNTEGIEKNNLLFNSCSIRKVITLNQHTHVY